MASALDAEPDDPAAQRDEDQEYAREEAANNAVLQSALDAAGKDDTEEGGGGDYSGGGQAPAAVPIGEPVSAEQALASGPPQTAQAAPAAAAGVGPALRGGPGYPAGFGLQRRVPAAAGPAMPIGEPIRGPGETPKPPEAGYFDVIARGGLRLFEDAQQVAAVANGRDPTPSTTAQADFEQPMTWSDFTSPDMLFKKMLFGAARSGAQIPAAILGGAGGSAIGTAVAGVPGAAVGGVTFAAAAAGAVGFVQELGTAYSAELQKTPDDREGAWEKAWRTSEKAGIISGLSMAMFGGPALFKSMLKGQFGVARGIEAATAGGTPAEAAAGREAAQAALKDTRGIPERAITQLGGQAAAVAAPTAAFNVAEGKPWDSDIMAALPGAAVNAATAAVGYSGRRIAGRYFGRPGVDADQEAALAQTQPGGEQLALPPPGPGNRPGTIEAGAPAEQLALPPPGPGNRPQLLGPQRGPAEAPDVVAGGAPAEQLALAPPAAGPTSAIPRPDTGAPDVIAGAAPAPEPRPTPPAGAAEPVQPSLPMEMPLPVARQAEPPIARPGEQVQPELPGMRPTQDRAGLPQPELPGVEESPQQRQMPPGEGAAAPIGPVSSETVPLSERAPTGPAVRGTTPEGWTVEPDHTGPGHVVKNADGNVIAVGDTPQQALQFARARHPDNVRTAAEAAAVEPVATEGTSAAPRAEGEVLTAEKPAVEPAVSRETAVKQEPVAEAAPAAGVPFMITAANKRELLDRGYTAAEIREMTPERAQNILATPATTKGGQLREKQAAKVKEKSAPVEAESGTKAAPKAEAPAEVSVSQRTALAEKHEAETRQILAEETVTPAWKEWVSKGGDLKAHIEGEVAKRMRAWHQGFDMSLAGREPPPERMSEVSMSRTDGYDAAEELKESAAKAKPAPAAEPVKASASPKPTRRERIQAEVDKGVEKARTKAAKADEATKTALLGAQQGAPPPIPKNPHMDREANRLLNEVLAGRMEPAAAHEAYGTGTKRIYNTFRDFVQASLEKARDPTAREEILARVELLNKLQEEGRVPAPAYKSALERINYELRAQDRLTNLRPKLEETLGALPEGRRTPIVSREISAQDARSNAVALATSRNIDQPVLDAIERGPTHLHAMLDTIINNPHAEVYAPQMHELAAALRRFMPDIPVEHSSRFEDQSMVEGNAGFYDNQSQRPGYTEAIYLNPETLREHPETGAAVTLLHETLHGATYRYVERLFTASDLNGTELRHKAVMLEIGKEVRRVLDRGPLRRTLRGEPALTADERFNLNYSLKAGGESGREGHELIPQLLSTPQLHRIMAETMASPTLRKALAELGYDQPPRATVWDAFKSAIRSVFRLPDKVGDSILDQVMRPLTDVTSAGINYRGDAPAVARNRVVGREVLDTPPAGQVAAGTERLKAASKRLGTDLGDAAALKAMRGSALSAHLDTIVNWAKGVFQTADGNALIDHREARQRVTKTAADESNRPTSVDADGNVRERAWQRVDRLAEQFRASKNPVELGKLMNETRQAGASMMPGADNSHVNPDVLDGLQRRFNALGQPDQQTWREIVRHNNEINLRERDAAVAGQVNRAFPDVPQAARQALAEQVRTRAGIDAMLADMDNNPVAQAFGAKWATSRRFAKLIAESQRMGMTDGDYFAARRWGNYGFRWGEPGTPSYGTHFFESLSEAQRVHRDYMQNKEGYPDLSAIFDKTKSETKLSLPDKVMAEFDGALSDLKLPQATQASLRDAFIGRMLQHGAIQAERNMRYEGVTGASTDQARALNYDFLSHTYRMGHLKHDGEVYDSLFQVDARARELSHDPAKQAEARTARLTHEELLKRMAPVDGDTTADLMGKTARGVTALTALYGLIRPAHIAYNLMDSHMTAASLLAGRHNAQGVAAVARAMAQLTGTALRAGGANALHLMRGELRSVNWDMSQLYRKRLIAAGMNEDYVNMLGDALDAASLVNVTPIREMRRMAGPQGFFGDLSRGIGPKIMDMLAMAEHSADSMARFAIAKGAFELELNRLGNNLENAKKATAYAVEIARQAMPNVAAHNRPRLASQFGPLRQFAAPILQYKQYGLQMYGVMANLAHEAWLKGGTERTEAVTALSTLLASHALMSGVGATIFGSLPMMVGLGIYDFFDPDSKRPHTNQMLQAESRNWVRRISGSKTMSDVWDRGIPMLGGVDASRSLTFANPLGINEWQTYDKAGALQWIAGMATGASGDTIATMYSGIKRALNGDWKGLISVLPRVVRDPVQAYQLGTEGLMNQAGTQQLLRPEQIPLYQRIAKGLGAIPGEVSTAQAGRHIEDLRRQTITDVHSTLLDNLVRLPPAQRGPAFQAIARYNKANPTTGISMDQITRKINEQAQANAMPGTFGLHLPVKQVPGARAIAAFAQP